MRVQVNRMSPRNERYGYSYRGACLVEDSIQLENRSFAPRACCRLTLYIPYVAFRSLRPLLRETLLLSSATSCEVTMLVPARAKSL